MKKKMVSHILGVFFACLVGNICKGNHDLLFAFRVHSEAIEFASIVSNNGSIGDSYEYSDSLEYDSLFENHIKKPRLLGKYDDFLKGALFRYEDEGKRCSKLKLKNWRRRLPEAIAPNVLLLQLHFTDSADRAYNKYNQRAKRIAKRIIKSGNGTRELPFDAVSLYDAYYFLNYEYGISPYKCDLLSESDGRILCEMILYLPGSDQIIIVYFDLTHLKDYYLLEIERIKRHNELLFGL